MISFVTCLFLLVNSFFKEKIFFFFLKKRKEKEKKPIKWNSDEAFWSNSTIHCQDGGIVVFIILDYWRRGLPGLY